MKKRQKIGAIIQARMGSTRCPGKTLRHVLGKPILWYMLDRLKHSNLLDETIIATTTNEKDQSIVDFCISNGLTYFRGREEDVLDRIYKAASKYNIDIVTRITSDCPLIDPGVVDEIIQYYLQNPEYDLVRSGPTYPEGFDVEVFPFKSLEIAWKEARLKSEREHVTAFIWKNAERFKIKTSVFYQDFSNIRITVDEEVDFQVVKFILENLYKKEELFHLDDILSLNQKNPEVFKLNQKVIRNEGYLKSLKKDEEIKMEA